jgi:hypothetical protein
MAKNKKPAEAGSISAPGALPSNNGKPADQPKKKPDIRKTVCMIDRERFMKEAKAATVTVDFHDGAPPQTFHALPREFSTGSIGWYYGGGGDPKLAATVDGTAVKIQTGLNLTIIGSKELPGTEEWVKENKRQKAAEATVK